MIWRPLSVRMLFRVKLHAPHRIFLMADAHDFAFLRLGGNFQAIGNRLPFDHQRMIPRRRKRVRHILEQSAPIMFDLRRLAVHDAVINNHFPAKGITDALVPKANAKKRRLRPKCADDVKRITQTHAASTAPAKRGSGSKLQIADLVQRNLVIALPDFPNPRSSRPDIERAVVSERIVIIDD